MIVLSKSCSICCSNVQAQLTTDVSALQVIDELSWQSQNIPDQSFTVLDLMYCEKSAKVLEGLKIKKPDGHSLRC